MGQPEWQQPYTSFGRSIALNPDATWHLKMLLFPLCCTGAPEKGRHCGPPCLIPQSAPAAAPAAYRALVVHANVTRGLRLTLKLLPAKVDCIASAHPQLRHKIVTDVLAREFVTPQPKVVVPAGQMALRKAALLPWLRAAYSAACDRCNWVASLGPFLDFPVQGPASTRT